MLALDAHLVATTACVLPAKATTLLAEMSEAQKAAIHRRKIIRRARSKKKPKSRFSKISKGGIRPDCSLPSGY